MPALEREQQMLERMANPDRRAVVQQALERHRRPDRIHAGDPAPDVPLIRLDAPDASPVRPGDLAQTSGRPVVLCFGSYT